MALASQQELWFALLAVAVAAIAFRMVRPAQYRALRVTWGLWALSLLALVAVTVLRSSTMLAITAFELSIVLGGLSAIHLLATIAFRAVLPRWAPACPALRMI